MSGKANMTWDHCGLLLVLIAIASLHAVEAFTVAKTRTRTLSKSICWESTNPAEKEEPIPSTDEEETPSLASSKVEVTEEELEAIESSPIFLSSNEDAGLLSSEDFINIAKRFLVKSKGIGGDAELLSDSFVFEAPVVGPFGKQQFVDAIGNVDFDLGFPDWKGEFYNFQVDVFEPNKVWYMAKGEGTNTGPFPTKDLPATYKKVINPPQICSLTIDPNTGLITKYTIGYVADRSVGNTGGLGGLYGILYAIGRPLPFPEALPWKPSLPYMAFQRIGSLLSKLQG